MPGDDALSDVLARIEFLLAEPVDFSRTDSEATATKVRLLAAAAAYFNVVAVSDFGGRAGPPREEGLVEQVVAAAFQTFGGHDPHPDHSTRPRCCCAASHKATRSTTGTSGRGSSWQGRRV